ncbi:MAG: hypothetical protein IPM82_04385 [Saprospiraceae bacterium]|nr:hypothetical protein [Saprospiraceae bacterium]
MNEAKRTAPLSNLQLELLKIYSAGVPDKYLDDLRILIARYLFPGWQGPKPTRFGMKKIH